jgi:hypothetical protein
MSYQLSRRGEFSDMRGLNTFLPTTLSLETTVDHFSQIGEKDRGTLLNAEILCLYLKRQVEHKAGSQQVSRGKFPRRNKVAG